MPKKNEVNRIERKEFIEQKSDELVKSGFSSSYHDAYCWIADNHYHCCVTTIYRALTEKEPVERTLNVFPTNQLNLF
jgi:hypothetical protein